MREPLMKITGCGLKRTSGETGGVLSAIIGACQLFLRPYDACGLWEYCAVREACSHNGKKVNS
jgi:hypothetical protein